MYEDLGNDANYETSRESPPQDFLYDANKQEILISTSTKEGEKSEERHPFQEFLYELRQEGVKASTSEWLDLQKVLAEGEVQSLDDLYIISRALLVKDVTGYPSFDTVLGKMFYGIEPPSTEDEEQNDHSDNNEPEPEQNQEQTEKPIQKESEGIEEVAEATSKTSEDVHGGDEATKDIKDSPNAADNGENPENHGAEKGQSSESQQKSGEGGGQQQQNDNGGGTQQKEGSGGGKQNTEGQGGEGQLNKETGGGKNREESKVGGLKKGKGGHSSARERITERHFDQYDKEAILNYDQIGRVLSRLTTIIQERTEIQTNHLDAERTIESIARNAGVPELVWKEETEDKPKVILMFDVGGSTDEFRPIMEKLFAGAKDYLQDVEVYYFHNAIYADVWLPKEGEWPERTLPIEKVLQKEPNSKVIMVGDAWMAEEELFGEVYISEKTGNHPTGLTGAGYFKQIADRFEHTVWINPIREDDRDSWDKSGTIGEIASIFPMYDLTLNGIEGAVKKLMEE